MSLKFEPSSEPIPISAKLLFLDGEQKDWHVILAVRSYSKALQNALAEVSPNPLYPGGNPGANIKSISHRCYLREIAFE